ncbi:MAG: hypothetical protein KatS3mg039_0210 [Candidatus Kapaibacterium sp.]|nr:MAG: hypothetical protein KatS3mg039_0210 [Candidatus Kapabacteria bacterium]
MKSAGAQVPTTSFVLLPALRIFATNVFHRLSLIAIEIVDHVQYREALLYRTEVGRRSFICGASD